MKILCIQLARLGDIYQTWPTLNGLRRKYPEAQIDLLVRERFSVATRGMKSVNEIRVLRTRDVLEPLLNSAENIENSRAILSQWVSELRDQKYDRVINLSFSPFSSYLVDMISHESTQISGYTRFNDGYLNIPDEPSGYFYAQVGVDRANHIHLTDIFGWISGVDLETEDLTWDPKNFPKLIEPLRTLSKPYWVIHTGASQLRKVPSSHQWTQIIQGILQSQDCYVVLVGAQNESIQNSLILDSQRIINLCGKTEVFELFPLIAKAQLLLGADSVCIHIASLTQTPTLNLSFSAVNFWETGPRAPLSRILWSIEPSKLDVNKVITECDRLSKGMPKGLDVIERIGEFGVLYDLDIDGSVDFEWELVKSIYLNQEFPKCSDSIVSQAFMRMNELSGMVLNQFNKIRERGLEGQNFEFLNQTDQLLERVASMVPEVSPVVRWFLTEKIRIPPGELEETFEKSSQIYKKLSEICQLYVANQTLSHSTSREDLTWKP